MMASITTIMLLFIFSNQILLPLPPPCSFSFSLTKFQFLQIFTALTIDSYQENEENQSMEGRLGQERWEDVENSLKKYSKEYKRDDILKKMNCHSDGGGQWLPSAPSCSSSSSPIKFYFHHHHHALFILSNQSSVLLDFYCPYDQIVTKRMKKTKAWK